MISLMRRAARSVSVTSAMRAPFLAFSLELPR
jgi:hypothetical protein